MTDRRGSQSSTAPPPHPSPADDALQLPVRLLPELNPPPIAPHGWQRQSTDGTVTFQAGFCTHAGFVMERAVIVPRQSVSEDNLTVGPRSGFGLRLARK